MRRAVGFSASAVVLPLLGSAGSVLAWTHWRPPLPAPAQSAVAQALGPLGSGLASTHGLSTTHGTIGLAAAIACVAGLVGLVLPGRLRMLAAVVIALASLAIAANGLTAFLSANHLQADWSSLVHAVGNGTTTSTLNGVTSAITRNALIPSAGAAGGGVLGLAGGMNALRGGMRSLRAVVPPRGLSPRMP